MAFLGLCMAWLLVCSDLVLSSSPARAEWVAMMLQEQL